MKDKNRMLLIKIPYWLGIGADALWAVGLLVPQVFCILSGNPDFNLDLQIRLIMVKGSSLPLALSPNLQKKYESTADLTPLHRRLRNFSRAKAKNF